MKYAGMPFAVWQFFYRSFERNLTAVFDVTKADARSIMAKGKEKYKEIIGNLSEFEKGDRFRMNIVGCAMLAAVVLNMSERPTAEKLTVYYRQSMMTNAMKWFCRMSGKRKFTHCGGETPGGFAFPSCPIGNCIAIRANT